VPSANRARDQVMVGRAEQPFEIGESGPRVLGSRGKRIDQRPDRTVADQKMGRRRRAPDIAHNVSAQAAATHLLEACD